MRTEFALSGLRADNPLGFLAALGTLRSASIAYGQSMVSMCWRRTEEGWTAVIGIAPDAASPVLGEQRLIDDLLRHLGQECNLQAFTIADDLKLDLPAFRASSLRAAAAASPENRAFADFMAAFGSEAVELRANGKPTGKITDTAFRTMSGAGHQHFLGFMRTLGNDVRAEHLQRALFAPWRYDDPLESHTLRWDPIDDVRYALRARDSSGDPERKRSGAMWGANRLAMEALPLLPTMPVAGGALETTGFTYFRGDGTAWTWPVWEGWCTADIARSLLAAPALQQVRPDRASLSRQGVKEVFRCYRIRQGKYRNLTPAFAV